MLPGQQDRTQIMSLFPASLRLVTLIALCGCAAPAPDSPRKPVASSNTNSIEQLTAAVRNSIVVITHYGRDGQEDGVGAGFVISADGLVATSLHVIGEARPIRVQFASGGRVEVTEVHATDRQFDLAILRIAATNLRSLLAIRKSKPDCATTAWKPKASMRHYCTSRGRFRTRAKNRFRCSRRSGGIVSRSPTRRNHSPRLGKFPRQIAIFRLKKNFTNPAI